LAYQDEFFVNNPLHVKKIMNIQLSSPVITLDKKAASLEAI
jgi:hypothetical protein